ncbi:MAG TPA: hypothetical protein VMT34_10880, partial [Aggregatilineales bacterium]|nr:hypothetical protein [Aggregatilineales bacterium]
MDFLKVWQIAMRTVRETFSNRNLILILIAAPILLTLIIGLAFSGLTSGDLNIDSIAIAVVNNDQGANMGFVSLNLGQ